MTSLETIHKISQKYSVSPEEFIKLGSCLAMREKKRAMQIEKIEMLARYGASTVNDLENKIKKRRCSRTSCLGRFNRDKKS